MSYWQLRLAFYREAIKSMRETLQQLGMAVVVFFQVALPAVFLFFLVGLGQLAEPSNSLAHYSAWLSGYGILIYGLLRFQRHAILGTAIKYWDSSLPIPESQRQLSTLGLSIVAGNVFLILPIGLLCYLFLTHIPESLSMTGIRQLWPLLITCLWGIQVSLLALHRQTFPVVSLIFVPFSLVFFADESMGSYWLLVLFIVPTLTSFIREQRFSVSPKIYFLWQLFIRYQQVHWQGLLLRFIALALCSLFFYNLIANVSPITRTWVLLFAVFVTATLAATVQFSLINFRARYQYFLMSLPIEASMINVQLLLVVIFIGFVFVLVSSSFIGNHWLFYLAWLLLYFLGLWSVSRFKQRFFIPLIALFGVFGTIVNFMPTAFMSV